MQMYVSKSNINGYVRKRPVTGDYPTKEWVEWSMQPHTEEEIKERVLWSRESVCYSYICKNSVLSEKFIIELAIMSLDNSITNDNYDEKMEELVPIFNENYDNRLDWWNISTYQKLSEQFIAKYQNLLDGKAILKNQILSEQFIKDRLCSFFVANDVIAYKREALSRDCINHIYIIARNVEKYQKALREGNQAYIDEIWNMPIKINVEEEDEYEG